MSFSLWKKRTPEFCIIVVVVVVVLGFGFWVFTVEDKEVQNSVLLVVVVVVFLGFQFSLLYEGFFSQSPLSFGFQFSGSCWVEGVFFFVRVSACCIQSPPRASVFLLCGFLFV